MENVFVDHQADGVPKVLQMFWIALKLKSFYFFAFSGSREQVNLQGERKAHAQEIER